MNPREKWARPDLPRYSWDQAHHLKLARATAFTPLGVSAPTIRRWVTEGRLEPVAKAPGGSFLFSIAAVSAVAATLHPGQGGCATRSSSAQYGAGRTTMPSGVS